MNPISGTGSVHANKQPIFLSTPKFQVMAAWLWNMVGALLISSILLAALPENTTLDIDTLRANPNLAIYPVLTEIVAVGLLPVLFVLFNREKIAVYGLQRQGLVKSLALSALVVLAFFAFLPDQAAQLTSSVSLGELNISSPWKLGLAILAILAYGPLEVFFVVWLIHNTDRLYNSSAKVLSAGLLVTILLYGVLHTFSQGMYAIVIAVIFLALGLIFKSTRNAIGPMLAWTVMNGYIWVLCGILLTQ